MKTLETESGHIVRLAGYREYFNADAALAAVDERPWIIKWYRDPEAARLEIARSWEARDLAHSRLSQEEIIADAIAEQPTQRLREECRRAHDEICERDGCAPFNICI